MKAVVYDRYGPPDVLQLTELPTPKPADDEILIKIHAVSINGSDREALIGEPWYARLGGIRRPRHRILGSDIAGRVEAVGKKHTEFKPGDDVHGELPGYRGGFAEYVCAHGKTMMLKPTNLTFEQAAAIPQGGVIAFNGIQKKGKVQAGQKVLINGAGGSAGAFAIQLAKRRGAEVTAVDNSFKLDFMRGLGADHVIDYEQQDFTRNGQQYDLILDVFAYRSVFAYERALRRNGTYFCVGGSVRSFFQILFFGPLIRAGGKRVRILVVSQNRKDLIAITDLCAASHILPVIDRRYSLSEVPDAMRYVAEGRAKGKVVINVQDV